MAEASWNLQPGDEIKRTELHNRFGGGRQGGISPSRTTPNILIFSDPASGHFHGYDDRWDGPVFLYVGEGQHGDQRLAGGNKAILEHRKTKRALRVFKGVGGDVQYLGEYAIDDDLPFTWDQAPGTGDGPMRKVVRFRLQPTWIARQAPPKSKRIYRPSNENPATTPSVPFDRDPNAIDRSLAAHARTQNRLREFLASRKLDVWSPGPDEPDFDLAWERKEVVWVGEVKSIVATNEACQLRLGLGQVLDYQDTMLLRYPNVRAALIVSEPPKDRRWVALCERHGVVLVWGATFEELLR